MFNIEIKNEKMKIINIVIAIILSFIVLYLIYIYNIHDKWTKPESALIILCLFIGSINSFILINQKRKKDKNP